MQKKFIFLFLAFAIFFSDSRSMQQSYNYHEDEIKLNEMISYQGGDVTNFVEEMTYCSNVLLIQRKYIAAVNQLIENIIAGFEITKELNEIKGGLACGDGITAFQVTTPDAFSLILKYSRIFTKFFDASGEVQELSGKGLLSYPNIQTLCDEWCCHKDCGIRQIGLVARIKLKQEKISQERTKILNKLIGISNKLDNENGGKYLFVSDVISRQQGVIQEKLSFIKQIQQITTNIMVLNDSDILKRFLEKAEPVIKSYQEQEATLINIYKKMVTATREVINKQPAHIKKELLRNYNKIFRVKYSKDRVSSVQPGQPLPFNLPLLIEKKEIEVNEESGDDDNQWLSHIKKGKPKVASPKGVKRNATGKKGASKAGSKKTGKSTLKAPAKKAPGQKKIKRAEDLSYLIKETEDYYEFSDEKNNLITRILKTDEAEHAVQWTNKELAAIIQTSWVNQWYDNPETALEKQGYMDCNNPKYTHPDNYWKAIAYHTPALALKSYLRLLAQQSTTANRRMPGQIDTVFTMPGVQFYKDKEVEPGKKWEAGILAWIVDGGDNKTNYHVEFRPTEISKMANDFLKDKLLNINFSEDEFAQC